MSDNASPVTPAEVVQNSVFERLARAGFVVNGLLHLIVGYLAIRIALGDGGTADQTGALATLAAKPGGPVILWFAATALLMLGLWRLVETALGRSSDRRRRARRRQRPTGRRPSAWRRSAWRSPTLRSDSRGVPESRPVNRTRASAHA